MPHTAYMGVLCPCNVELISGCVLTAACTANHYDDVIVIVYHVLPVRPIKDV